MMREEAERDAILARLKQSRADIRRLLEPPPEGAPAARWAPHGVTGEFPRSRTMQLLMNGRSLGIIGAVVGGLLLARPRVALRLIRFLPIGALARELLPRAMTALRAISALRAQQD